MLEGSWAFNYLTRGVVVTTERPDLTEGPNAPNSLQIFRISVLVNEASTGRGGDQCVQVSFFCGFGEMTAIVPMITNTFPTQPIGPGKMPTPMI